MLLRATVETFDIEALSEVAALVTAEGARTSHAAVVARQLGRTCVVGYDSLVIDGSGRAGAFGAARIGEGDLLSVDGATGEIFLGEVPVDRKRPTELLQAVRRRQQAEDGAGGAADRASPVALTGAL